MSAERRLKELGIRLPDPPEPFGRYKEAVQAGSLLFLSGTLPTEGRTAKFIGRVGVELDTAAGREAARLAAMNAFAQEHLFGIRVLQLLGRGTIARAEYDEINAGHRDAYLLQIRADAADAMLVDPEQIMGAL